MKVDAGFDQIFYAQDLTARGPKKAHFWHLESSGLHNSGVLRPISMFNTNLESVIDTL